ncbi:hypothetical protein Hanom_Chr17g01567601 [Helianthus anomalus]
MTVLPRVQEKKRLKLEIFEGQIGHDKHESLLLQVHESSSQNGIVHRPPTFVVPTLAHYRDLQIYKGLYYKRRENIKENRSTTINYIS